MPATLVPLHSTPAELVPLEDLTVTERALALYASDMPRRYYLRREGCGQVRTWIAQGVQRLGLKELHYLAAVRREHRLAWMNGVTETEEYAEPFSDTPRLLRAEGVASTTVFYDGMGVSQSAIARSDMSAAELRPVPEAVAA
jgi:hypothetical protein